uniref:Uncharacterized protein n=1 Tax=Anguilla anguilla TaxID=7936 RepID=A0A0E9PJM6_ANGAN
MLWIARRVVLFSPWFIAHGLPRKLIRQEFLSVCSIHTRARVFMLELTFYKCKGVGSEYIICIAGYLYFMLTLFDLCIFISSSYHSRKKFNMNSFTEIIKEF